jgi:branched-chain amino acid transport system substrate-binding protein
LRDAIATTDINGATGRTKIDEHRDAPKAAVIITVENGKFKFLRDVQP